MLSEDNLFSAVKEGDITKVSKLLQSGEGISVIDINKKDNDGRSALMYAAAGGHVDAVRLLLGYQGIDVNQKDNDDRSALMYAAAGGHVDAVGLLLGYQGIDVNQKDAYSKSALMYAAENGHTDVVRSLLNKQDIEVIFPSSAHKLALFQKVAEKCFYDIFAQLLEKRQGIYNLPKKDINVLQNLIVAHLEKCPDESIRQRLIAIQQTLATVPEIRELAKLQEVSKDCHDQLSSLDNSNNAQNEVAVNFALAVTAIASAKTKKQRE